MKQVIINEITFSLLLLALAALFLDPFMVWMPGAVVYMLMGGIIAAYAVFAGLIWKERAFDERGEYHRILASRAGYVFGAGVLIVGILWQTVFSHVDAWLVVALVGMVCGKLLGFYYSALKK